MGCSCRVQTEEGIQAGWRRSDLPWLQLAKGNICMQTRSEVTNQVKQGHEDASAWDGFNTMPVTNQSLKKIHMKWLQTTLIVKVVHHHLPGRRFVVAVYLVISESVGERSPGAWRHLVEIFCKIATPATRNHPCRAPVSEVHQFSCLCLIWYVINLASISSS